MSTLRLIAIWGILVGVAIMTRQTAADYAAGVFTIAAMLPLAMVTGEGKLKRVEVPMAAQRWRR
jgi:hypothetical protein